MTDRATVLLVDDHPLFREGFAQMAGALRPQWDLLFASSISEGMACLRDHPHTDLAIIDITLPDGDGFGMLEQVARDAPTMPCLVISGREDMSSRRRAKAAGASGFVAKATPPDAVADAIDVVLGGGLAFDDDPLDISPPLTARQAEILALVAEGHGNKEICFRLGIAERTVRAHLTEIFAQLGVSGRVQAIVRARVLGLIS